MMDYDEIGFKCGIEIHQQLDTATKLFCSCSTDVENEAAVAKVRRKLRPVPGESGEVDRAAKFEHLQDKEFVYNVYRDVTCLVEMDEEPPHPVNQEALDTAMQFALMLDCDVPDEVHVMRKTVIDGSNTTGFQRTTIIGMDGALETEHGTVKIPDVELEEESAGIHARENNRAVYDLNRLGIPLIEVGTDASIRSPEHAKEVAMELGMLLRSTGNVKRGLGTIRQDVNVSIEGGARIEIKGFQDVRNMDELVRNEVERQRKLLEIKERLEERDISGVSAEVQDMTERFDDTDNEIIGSIIDEGGKVYATKIPFEGLMNVEICGSKTLGKELSEYAAKHGVNGIMHTDEDVSRYGLEDEFEMLSDALDKDEGETVVLVAGGDEEGRNALEAVVERASQCLEGVPEETRVANQDFTTSYARPLPGAARMYPETDIPPFPVTDEYLAEVEQEMPETLREREQRLSEEIGEQMAGQLADSQYFPVFEKAVERTSLDPRDVANVFVNIVPDVESRHDVDTDNLTEEHFLSVFELYESDEVGKDALPVLFRELAASPEKTAEDVVEEQGLGAMGEEEVREIVREVIERHTDMIEEQGEHARGALMGEIMQEVGGQADGSLVNKVLSEELEKAL